ncbi:universal stress protein [bacterium]|nr:universal stress protein [bacterium]
MVPFKKILWPTDFSEPSFKALQAANELAVHFKAHLYAVHVVAPIPVPSAPSGPTSFNIAVYKDNLDTSAKKALQDVMKNRISQDLEKTPVVTHGNAADEIVRIADEQKVDLIVLATHGLTGVRHFISGSVAEKVVRISNHPVLTIRASQKE